MNERVDESSYLVNPDTVDNGVLLNGPGLGQKRTVQPLAASSGNVVKGSSSRRKTLEPKVLFPDSGKRLPSGQKGQLTLHGGSVIAHNACEGLLIANMPSCSF